MKRTITLGVMFSLVVSCIAFVSVGEHTSNKVHVNNEFDVSVVPPIVKLGMNVTVTVTVFLNDQPYEGGKIRVYSQIPGLLVKELYNTTNDEGVTSFFIRTIASGEILIEVDNQSTDVTLFSKSNIIYVDDDYNESTCGFGKWTFKRIQDAIDHSYDNDWIFVYSGTYMEHININTSITLKGENKNTTIITPPSSEQDAVLIGKNQTSISGVSIQYTLCYYPNPVIAGLRIRSDENSIYNNIFSMNEYGLLLENSKGNDIYRNIFQNDTVSLTLINSEHNTIENNTVQDNYECFSIKESNYNGFLNNKIIDHYRGVFLHHSNNNTFLKNTFKDNIFTMNLFYSDSNIIKENTFDQIKEQVEYVLSLSRGHQNLIFHNNFGPGSYYDRSEAGNNSWHNPDISEGNYWSTYHGDDTNADGIGDIPFDQIKGNVENQDPRPLMYRFPDSTEPACSILQPTGFLYLNNEPILPLSQSIIIGPILIDVYAHDWESRMWKIEFYANDEILFTDDEKPYAYFWNDVSFGRYTLRVLAYDHSGNTNEYEQVVWKFF